MDVTIRWSATGAHRGACDVWTAPRERRWSGLRVELAEPDEGLWCIRIGPVRSGACDDAHDVVEIAAASAESAAAYRTWLADNVEAVYVNGLAWWQRPTPAEIDMEGFEERLAETHGKTATRATGPVGGPDGDGDAGCAEDADGDVPDVD